MGGSGNIKSSNSQLFKGSEGSGAAIPLTFNNSIAEVLAAAAGKTKLNKSREPSPKPEITITAKNSKIGSNTSIEALKITKKNPNGNPVGNLGKKNLLHEKSDLYIKPKKLQNYITISYNKTK